ncbi:S-adenosyl-L-methionine-dependent methyltransferase [Lophium mytilinum]|uniref:DNA (cytosine-5-)-methyltransferase n=1 Tax=Lophium mytilinum TaxID=390894 RepID=A0A6A6QTX1_9PEZI|nr:S-adenosyl-L-methionine-dependent methyltransferase [Lophium mytilinum]
MSSKKGHVFVAPSDLTHPKSVFEGGSPPWPITQEGSAFQALKAERNTQGLDGDYVVFELQEFRVYRPDSGRLANELEPLQALRTVPGLHKLLFDGILVCGNVRRYVQAVEFGVLSNEWNPDVEAPTLSTYIQSNLGEQYGFWYKLGEPASEYRRYHKPYLWIASFGLHVVDYLYDHKSVCLDDFKQHFHDWLREKHQVGISEWLAEYGRTDFRVAVSAYVEYLYHESCSIKESFGNRPMWKETLPWALAAVKVWEAKTSKTICSPHVYECFRRSYFGDQLELSEPAPEIAAVQEKRKKELGFMKASTDPKAEKISNGVTPNDWEPSKGDVVALSREANSLWKKSKADIWMAYVQETHRDKKGELFLSIVWLYGPEDTTIDMEHYPYQNERFFSDHCECSGPKRPASDVLDRVDVSWCPSVMPANDQIFVRTKYCSQNESFVTLDMTDRSCSCQKESRTAFEGIVETRKVGDTVYFLEKKAQSPTGHDTLEPVVIESFDYLDQAVRIRRLLRRARDCSTLEIQSFQNIRPNELVWTEETMLVRADRIAHSCNIRFLTTKENVPSPYNRDGVADCWYIRTALISDQLQAFEEITFKPNMSEGFERTDLEVKLVGLSLFSGGGSFDRSLEECGAVDFVLGVDMFSAAMHTWKANLRGGPTSASTYCGSVDDYYLAIQQGDPDVYPHARIGQITFICGGSPCQGYARMNRHKLSEASKRNSSHITTFASNVDLYSPLYAILENVPEAAGRISKDIPDNPFAQLIACLVSMGYQVQQFKLDAWSHSSSQSRSRLFLSVAAPGLKPLPPPTSTHSHPPTKTRVNAIGKLPNGEAFGERTVVVTPFAYTTSEAASQDLPSIQDSRVQTCIPYPDHINSTISKWADRRLFSLIPTYPYGQTYVTTLKEMATFNEMSRLKETVMPQFFLEKQIRHTEESGGKSYGRIRPDGLFPTIATVLNPRCKYVGQVLHWREPRVMTIQEARRAQGIPDDVVLIGTLAEKLKITGNGVDYSLGLTLGYSLRQSVSPNQNYPIPYNRSGHSGQEVIAVTKGRALINYTTVEGITGSRTFLNVESTETTERFRNHTPGRPDISRKQESRKNNLNNLSMNKIQRALSEATEGQRFSKHEKKAHRSIDRSSRHRALPNAAPDQEPRKRTRQNTTGTELVAPADFSKIPEKLSRKSITTNTSTTSNDEGDSEDEGPFMPKQLWKRVTKTDGVGSFE